MLQPLHKLSGLVEEDALPLGAVSAVVPLEDRLLTQYVRYKTKPAGVNSLYMLIINGNSGLISVMLCSFPQTH